MENNEKYYCHTARNVSIRMRLTFRNGDYLQQYLNISLFTTARRNNFVFFWFFWWRKTAFVCISMHTPNI